MDLIRFLIALTGCTLQAFALFQTEPVSAGIETRQFNFGGFRPFQQQQQLQFGGGQNNFPTRQQNFNQGNQQTQQQQNLPPLAGFNPNAPAGVQHLVEEKFPVQDDLSQDMAGKLPGINSGFITANPPAQTQNKIATSEDHPTDAKSCTPSNKEITATGVCANAFDVVIGRRCVGTRTTKSDDCSAGDTCCFKLANKEVIDSAVAFDQVPCGMRRTPQLAQRELTRVAHEENIEVMNERILGGLEAFQNEICWQAAILVDGKYVCGGAVLNSRNVITAGHCLNDVERLSQVEVITGTKDLKNQGRCADHFKASNVVFNDNYDPRSLNFDMAIIELDKAITNTNCTCRVCLPDANVDKEKLGGLNCIVTGFGTTQPGKTSDDVGPLNIANVSVIPQLPDSPKCSDRLHLSPAIPKKFTPDSSMICAIGEDPTQFSDTCDLDGGSPLACQMNSQAQDVYTLVGLSSWGLPCGKNVVRDQSGNEVRVPTVYAYIRPSMNWIEQTIRLK